MPLEDPDTATAGTGPSQLNGRDAPGRRVAILVGVAALTVAVVVAVAVLVGGGDGDPAGQLAAAGHNRSRQLAEVDSLTNGGGSSTTTTSASVPGVPRVAVGPAGPGGCAASWTVDDGGSPLVEFFVTLESAPAPPGPDGTEIGTAMQLERTTATTAIVDVGGTIRVVAVNALGRGPTSEPIVCG